MNRTGKKTHRRKQSLKTAFKTLAALICLSCVATLQAAEKDLLLDLRFDGESGSKCVDLADKMTMALLTGEELPERVAGRFGEGLRFSKKNHYLQIRRSKDLEPSEFTFSCWFKADELKGNTSLFQGPKSRVLYEGFAIGLENGRPRIILNTGGETAKKFLAAKGKGDVKTGVWTHLAFSYDGNKVRMHRDGEKIYEKEAKGKIKYRPGGRPNMLLGTCPGGLCRGVIDEAKLYGQALAEDEIAQLAGKNFKFELGPTPANAGQAEKGKFHWFCHPRTYCGAKMLDRCVGFTGKPNNRFFDGDEKRVVLKIRNLDDKEVVFTLKTKLADAWLKNTLDEKSREVRVPANGTLDEIIDLETGQKGCFLAKIEVSRDGRTLYSASHSYAVTVTQDPDFQSKDTPFCHHCHHGVYMDRFTPEISASVVRLWNYAVCWLNIERKKGEFDWEATDFIIDHYHKKGKKILFVLAYTPLWASSAPEGVGTYIVPRYPPKDIKDWKNFVRQLVRRYKDKVKLWELWNEPDSDYFMGSADEYFEMLKTAYQILKEEDPECLVVGLAGTSNWHSFAKRVFDLGGLKFMDIFSIHLYGGSSRFPSMLEAARKLMRSYGEELPIWDTESGCMMPMRKENGEMFDVPHGQKMLPSVYRGKPWKLSGERRRSATGIQGRLVQLANGVEKTFLFDQQCAVKGVYPLVLVAWEAMVKNICDRKFVRRLPLGDNNLHAYLFAGEPNVVALWAAEGESDVILDCDSEKVDLVDFVGNATAKAANKPLSVHLDRYPKYLVGCGLKIGPGSQLFELIPPERVVRGQKLEFKLKNASTDEGEFKLEISNKTMTSAYASATLKIPAGEEKSAFLDLPAKTPEGSAFLVATMTGAKDLKQVKTAPVRVESPPTPINEAVEFKIDGAFGDWAKMEKFRLNKLEQVKIGRKNPMFYGIPHWRDIDDLSGCFSLAWTPAGLYFAAQITDDQLKLAKNPETPFKGDCLELFFDLRQGDEFGKQHYSPGVVQLLLSPPDKSEKAKLIVSSGCSRTVDETAVAGIRVEGKASLNGYIVEAFIPAKIFGVEQLAKNTVFGFDLAIDDADYHEKNSGRKVQMVFHGGSDSYRNASKFATFKIK